MSKKTGFTTYNNREAYFSELKPHVDAIFAKCKELDIPCILSICHSMDESEDGERAQAVVSLTCNFVGQDKTPPSYIVAAVAIEEGPLEAARAAFVIGTGGDYQAEKLTEDGATVQ